MASVGWFKQTKKDICESMCTKACPSSSGCRECLLMIWRYMAPWHHVDIFYESTLHFVVCTMAWIWVRASPSGIQRDGGWYSGAFVGLIRLVTLVAIIATMILVSYHIFHIIWHHNLFWQLVVCTWEWLSARLWYLQCVCNGDASVLH